MDVLVPVLCGYCFHFKPLIHTFKIGESVRICHLCYENHTKAIEELAKKPPSECAGCRQSWEKLCEMIVGDTVPMYPHYLDGCYQMLCRECSDKRMRKTPQPFKGTRFAHEQKL